MLILAECLKIRGMIDRNSENVDLDQIKAVIKEWCHDNGGVLTVDMLVSFLFVRANFS